MSEHESDTDTTDQDTTESETPDVESLTAELAKWKAQSRKHEERAKANAKAATELEDLRQKTMTDQERAVATAREEARAEALAEAGEGRAIDAIRAAAAGRPVDVEALVEGVDPARFLGDTGEPDREAIEAWISRVAPERAAAGSDFGQGARGVPESDQRSLNGDPLLRDLKSKLGIPAG